MALVAADPVQDEIRARVKRMQEMFADDPDVARIEYRFGEDWSGDAGLFVLVVLASPTPSRETIRRLGDQFSKALLHVVFSEEFDMHSYLNFESGPKNGA